MVPPSPAGARSWRPIAIVAAALAAILVLAVLADQRLLVADPDASAVTAADVRLGRSLLGGATPPAEQLVEACIDDEGTIDPACLGDGELPAGVDEITAEVVPRACREETSIDAACVERELGIDVPGECVGPEGGVDVSCLTGRGSLLVLTDQCLEDDRLRQECLTRGIYGVPDQEVDDELLGDLPVPDVVPGTGPEADAAPDPPEPDDPATTPEEPPGESSLAHTIAVLLQLVATALLVGLALFLLFVGVRALRRGRRPGAVVGPGPEEDHDRAVMAASVEAGAQQLDLEGDPRQAIIAAYAMLLEGLAACAQGRDPSETPIEHLERVLAALDVRPDPLRELTTLFGEARFSDHPMTGDQRDRARAALEAAAADLDRVRAAVG